MSRRSFLLFPLLLLAIIGYLLDLSILGFGGGLFGNILGAVLVVLLFVGGAWLADWIEHRNEKKVAPRPPA